MNYIVPPHFPRYINRAIFHALWAIPLLALILLTVVVRVTALDWKVTEWIFNFEHGRFLPPEWALLTYRIAPWPGMAIAVGSLILLIVGFRWKIDGRWQRTAGFFVLTMLIGPGLIVNSIFKDHFGRPRPVQVQEYGGHLQYLPVWEPGHAQPARSFPCGHASVGFFLMLPFFLWISVNRGLAFAALGLGLFWGGVIGTGRLMQGGHWLSDVLWSAGFVYFTGFALAMVFGFLRPYPDYSIKRQTIH